MTRRLLISTPTRCGVCLSDCLLIEAMGFHALVEIDSRGSKVPHQCPTRAVEAWRRQDRSHRASILARIAKEDQDDGPR